MSIFMSAVIFSVYVWEEPEELQMSLLFCLSCVIWLKTHVHVVFIEPGINMHCYGRYVHKMLATSVSLCSPADACCILGLFWRITWVSHRTGCSLRLLYLSGRFWGITEQ